MEEKNNVKENKSVDEKEKEKEEIEKLKEKLLYNRENVWNERKDEIDKIMEHAKGYMKFLDNSKIEREATNEIIHILNDNGYVNISEKESLQKGDKVYYINSDKSVYAAEIGDNIQEGMNIIGAHIDSPRLDIRPNPLTEAGNMLYAKTHYYGGIKKYQWTTIPLAIKGVIIKRDGSKLNISIGEEESDPVFTVSDLLVHLANDQMRKRALDVVEGEKLNITIGGIPISDTKCGIKLSILKMLNEKYDITEKDFLTAELCAVPAFKSRDLGIDRAFVLGYGQDDKVCAYAALRAMISSKTNKTKVCIFSDKEEIGSMGRTGMESELFDMFIAEILEKLNIVTPNAIRKVYSNSNMLSADVDGAYDANYPESFEMQNNSLISSGVVLNKYTGAGGKYDGSDASAEYLSKVARIFDKNNINYQVTELGKIDKGGGGTIAYILANKGISVVDCGIALQSMHAPYEIASKADIYEMYLAYVAFLNEA